MSEITVTDYTIFLKYQLLEASIEEVIFHLELVMHHIIKYDKVLEEYQTDHPNFVFVYSELRELVFGFKNLAKDLEKLIIEFTEVEKELGLPANFAYRKMLKSIQQYPIPDLPIL